MFRNRFFLNGLMVVLIWLLGIFLLMSLVSAANVSSTISEREGNSSIFSEETVFASNTTKNDNQYQTYDFQTQAASSDPYEPNNSLFSAYDSGAGSAGTRPHSWCVGTLNGCTNPMATLHSSTDKDWYKFYYG